MPKVTHIPRYTYDDYKLWKDDWELIDGYPYSMSPSAIGKHQFTMMKLVKQIINPLDESPCIEKCFVYTDIDWIISEDTVVRPDISIVCGEKIENFIESPPLLIVEILSKSSAYRDQIVKKELYEINKVKYYLIADPDTKTVESFELSDGKYQPKKDKGFSLNEPCEIHLDYSIIW
ncbi:MAG: Uma2 family endonuclease [Chlorobi bacterium]|nr:Uma2 family endonuclease [Chlorobiota bacterium]